MKLSEMRELLTREDIQLTKSLGQNFLHDGNQLRRIVDAAELSRADKVLEIGPGLGPLTDLLLKNAGEVLAIEKDGRLVGVLKKRFDVDASPEKIETGRMPVQRSRQGIPNRRMRRGIRTVDALEIMPRRFNLIQFSAHHFLGPSGASTGPPGPFGKMPVCL